MNDRSKSWTRNSITDIHLSPPTTVFEMRQLGRAAAAYSGDTLLASIPETPTTPARWRAYASWVARFASEALPPIRRDVIEDDELGVVVYYDNNPVGDRRDRAHAALRVLLADLNVETLAAESHPASGDDTGYTTALVLRGVDVQRIRRAVSACLAGQNLGGRRGSELP